MNQKYSQPNICVLWPFISVFLFYSIIKISTLYESRSLNRCLLFVRRYNRGGTLYPSKCPRTVSLSTGAQVTLMVVPFSRRMPTFSGASSGTGKHDPERCLYTSPLGASELLLLLFTIFSGVADDRVRLRSQPFLIDSLDFHLKGRKVLYVIDYKRWCGCVFFMPVRPAAHHSPPHHPVLKVGAVKVTFVHFLQRRGNDFVVFSVFFIKLCALRDQVYLPGNDQSVWVSGLTPHIFRVTVRSCELKSNKMAFLTKFD